MRQQVLRFPRTKREKKAALARAEKNVVLAAVPIPARRGPSTVKLSTSKDLDRAFIAITEKMRDTRGNQRPGGHAPWDVRRSKAAAATTAADGDAGFAAAAMGALAAAPRPADLAAVDPTLPPERQEREAAILTRSRREMVRGRKRKTKIFCAFVCGATKTRGGNPLSFRS